jgi:hypothetical protein
MDTKNRAHDRWRLTVLAAILLLPLLYLFAFHAPIPQDKGYHVFADARTCLGVPHFGNVASNLAFLIVGAWGVWRCVREREGAWLSWTVFFAGVALVFFGSAYYHAAPSDERLVWDRLPMAFAFTGLFAAMVSEHIGERHERALLIPAFVLGVVSIVWWRMADDLRLYGWVQGAPLAAIPLVMLLFPARYTQRGYLLYGLAFYLAAKGAEMLDNEIYAALGTAISGHSLKHLLAAGAPLMLLLMLRRRKTV